MFSFLCKFFQNKSIDCFATIPLEACRITKPHLLERVGITQGSVILMVIPYFSKACLASDRNLSAYAVSKDYHGFFQALFDELLPELNRRFPQFRFAGFADHSPIAEGDAAVRAGLGFFGCNHLFLTTEYSSYVFLGEIVTDAVIEAPAGEIKVCPTCGACRAACLVDLTVGECRSALTPKKGALTDAEQKTILSNGCAWGCDRCQEACPITQAAKQSGSIYTTIPFFKDTAIPHLTEDAIRAMSEDAFAARAYSWRGRAVILRNLELLEKGEMI